MTETVTSTVLNAKQAAALIHVSEKTVLRWIKEQGRLPAVKTQDGWAIDRADLERAAQGLAPDRDGERPVTPALQLARFQTSGESLVSGLANAIQNAVAEPLLNRLEAQAERIGQLEAQLAQATAPKPARPPRAKPAIARIAIPLEPEAAARRIREKFSPPDLARLAMMLDPTTVFHSR